MASTENKDKAGVFKPKLLLCSTLAGFAALVVLFIILSIAIGRMLLPEDWICFLALAVCAVCAFISAMLYSGRAQAQKILSALLSGAAFFVLLLIVGLFIPDTVFSASRMLVSAAVVMVSSLLSAVFRAGTQANRGYKKK